MPPSVVSQAIAHEFESHSSHYVMATMTEGNHDGAQAKRRRFACHRGHAKKVPRRSKAAKMHDGADPTER